MDQAGTGQKSRRGFLGDFATGLQGMALAGLLQPGIVRAERTPIRPRIDPQRPYAPRSTHHAPKAQQVQMGRW